ncbi:Pre-mRNA-splicing factor SLU7 [Paramuricea clavata]|uniref:Pre-mRNA-splicing factor SLU7 n=1 Tax=Paramuricea clavata TaxID=317549 RepID=A0A7D9DKG7_PARCT|nr:Pre-mRNA-splicing factor SLU7 [Paramuricea clavata]
MEVIGVKGMNLEAANVKGMNVEAIGMNVEAASVKGMNVEAASVKGCRKKSCGIEMRCERCERSERYQCGSSEKLSDKNRRTLRSPVPQYLLYASRQCNILQKPTLKHQRPQEEKQKQFAKIDASYKRGTKETSAIKYRKGACENCGAMTHKKKDCLERPRRVGARFTGEDIRPDEYLPEQVNFDYDGKRDRWVGYDSEEHQRVLEEYQKMEMAKQQLKSDKLHQDLMDGKKIEEKEKLSDDDEEDEDKYADDVIIPGQKFDSKRRTTVRNLRIREDTAKYLYNLDPNSAHYDPKTRSMRTNPFGLKDIAGKAVTYQGDNFVRYSGDTQKMANTQLFAWEAYEKGTDVHLQADPTKLELLHREYKVKKEDFKQDLKGGVLEKYGGEEHLNAPPKELLFAQTENYVEYSRTGEVVKGTLYQIQLQCIVLNCEYTLSAHLLKSS